MRDKPTRCVHLTHRDRMDPDRSRLYLSKRFGNATKPLPQPDLITPAYDGMPGYSRCEGEQTDSVKERV